MWRLLSMKTLILKLGILLLTAGQIIPAHGMWGNAARTALSISAKKSLSFNTIRSLSTGILPQSSQLQPIGSSQKPMVNQPQVSRKATLKQQKTNYDNYWYGHRSNNRQRSQYKPFFYGSAISALALYAYASAEPESCSADETAETQESTSSRICEEPSEQEAETPYAYSINLMWVNRKFEPNQKYIHPSANLEELEKNLLNTVYRWAESNPQATVHVWYDSAFLTPEAIQNTQAAIVSYRATHPDSAHIQLKDVRELAHVKENPEIFSDKTPVFFRVDLLRVIETVDVLTQSEQLTYFVYTDLDAQPMTKDELFDKETLLNLKKYGIITSVNTFYGWGYENSFHIMSNQKPHLFTAVNHALIELNILRAQNALKGNFRNEHYPSPSTPIRDLSETVYHSYPLMLLYFLHLDNQIQMTYNGSSYDYETHGVEPLETEHLKYCYQHIICKRPDGFYYHHFECKTEDHEIIEKMKHRTMGWLGATKKINAPPPKGSYDNALPDSEQLLLSQPLLSENTKIAISLGAFAIAGGMIAWWLNK